MPIPTDVANLTCWLRADVGTGGVNADDPISTWTDQSGTGHNFTATTTTRPTYQPSALNGLPTVRGDGIDDFMVGPVMNTIVALNNATVLAAVRPTAATSFASPEDNPPIFMAAGGDLGLLCKDVSGSVNVLGTNFDGTQDTAIATTTPALGSAFVCVMDHNTSVRASVNGETQVATVSGNTNNVTGLARLFNRGAGNGFLGGDIGELLIYNRVLSGTERGDMETYLTKRWITPQVLEARDDFETTWIGPF